MQPIERLRQIDGLVTRDAGTELVPAKWLDLPEALSTSENKVTHLAFGGVRIGKIVPGVAG